MKSTVLWLFLAGFTGLASGQNLICNGGFESPAAVGDYLVTDVPCWQTTTNQKIELQGKSLGGATNVQGNQYVELDVASNSDIYQDIPTEPGKRYLVRFWMANRSGSPRSAYKLLWDGAVVGSALRAAGETAFIRVNAEVVATKTVSRVTLAADGPSDGVGDLIDEVSVVPIPFAGSRLGYNYYIPHFADGDTWVSTISLSSTSPLGFFSNNIEYTVYGDDGKELDARLNRVLTLNPAGSVTVDSPRPAALRAGWVKITSSEPLAASVIFRNIIPGRFDLEATVPAREPTTVTVAPFDNTDFTTGFAVANPVLIPITLSFTFVDSGGTLISTETLPLGARAHTSFALGSKFSRTANKKGQVRIAASDASGNPALFVPLGLR
jgi:hypothetical protein